MKIKQLNAAFLVILAVAASIAFAACDNSFGVFHEIQTEKAQTGTDIFENVTVKTLAEDNTNYYAAMAKIFYRSTSGDTWSVFSIPISSTADIGTDYYCAGLTSNDSGTIYVASTDMSSTAALNGIYSTSDSGDTWNQLDDAEFDSKIVDSLFYTNNTLFVSAHTDTEADAKYYLYYYDGSNFVIATGLTDLDIPVTGIVYSGSVYWAMTSSTLYQSATTPDNFVADSTSGTPSSDKTLCGIAADSLSANVFVTTDDGYLYTYTSSTWSSDLLSSSVELGVLAEVPIDDTASAYRLLVAKHNSSYGYYEYNAATKDTPLSGNDDDAIFAPTASSYTTTIYQKPVLAFHYSTANKTLLIGLAAQSTDTYALYSNTVSGSTWSGWTAE